MHMPKFLVFISIFFGFFQLFGQSKLSGINVVLYEAIDSLILDFELETNRKDEKYVILIEIYEQSDSSYFVGRVNDGLLRYWEFVQGTFRISITSAIEGLESRPPAYYLQVNKRFIFIYTGIEGIVTRDQFYVKKYKEFLKKNFRWMTGPAIFRTWIIYLDEINENRITILSRGL
jgi:hypothetical protein